MPSTYHAHIISSHKFAFIHTSPTFFYLYHPLGIDSQQHYHRKKNETCHTCYYDVTYRHLNHRQCRSHLQIIHISIKPSKCGDDSTICDMYDYYCFPDSIPHGVSSFKYCWFTSFFTCLFDFDQHKHREMKYFTVSTSFYGNQKINKKVVTFSRSNF